MRGAEAGGGGTRRAAASRGLGRRIYENVSKEGWSEWLQRLQMIINENQISTADPGSIELIEQHMRGFLFGEGNLGGLPAGFRTGRAKK